jgi:cell division protein FtsW (lipid II flippase)
MTALRLLLKTWKGIAHKIGNFQARVILSLFYFTVLIPFALRVKIFSDPLQLKRFSGWMSRDRTDADAFEMARRQF